jgi:2-C-methyl-D-erythritol 4-phosphate cytidylyltransferase
MNIIGVVPAAGVGKRMGSYCKKPFLLLQGRPILYYILKVLDTVAAIDQVIVAVYPGEERICQKEIVDKFSINKKVTIVPGGVSRQESVRKALDVVPKNCDMMLIHDGARPLISQQMMIDAIKATEKWKATAMGVPAKDTIKIVRKDGIIEKTPPRETLWSIQTPQTFEKNLIVEAHRKAFYEGFAGTDDASLVERLGISVKIIMGSYENIKVTTKEDLLMAEAFLDKRKKGLYENRSRK